MLLVVVKSDSLVKVDVNILMLAFHIISVHLSNFKATVILRLLYDPPTGLLTKDDKRL